MQNKLQSQQMSIEQALSQAKKLVKKGSVLDAKQLYDSILQYQPQHPIAKKNLRKLQKSNKFKNEILNKPTDQQIDELKKLFDSGQMIKVEKQCRNLLIKYPRAVILIDILGAALIGQGKYAESVPVFSKAVAMNPNHSQAFNNLGNALKNTGLLNDSLKNFNKAINLNPNYAEFYSNRANVHDELGEPLKALDDYNKCIELMPDSSLFNSCRIFTLNYCVGISKGEIFNKHREFEKRFCRKIKQDNLSNKTIVNNNRLRVAYVSPDFNEHSVAYFFKPLLNSHNRNLIETFCYYNHTKNDDITKNIMKEVEHWRSIVELNDKDVFDLIRKDSIDILVDLSGHTRNNRLTVFTYKPAPIQITWLGYPNTTGLNAMDYRFTDAIADPIGESDKFNCENLIRLPNGFLCYQGDNSVPFNDELPAIKAGNITFGSFNNLNKVNDKVILLWSKVLQEVPNSILILKSKQLTDSGVKSRYLDLFKKAGVSKSRIQLYSHLDNKDDHLGLYNVIDIGLDPFPYNGTTTTCEALWMGVPTLTLKGDRHASRVGSSIMTHVGLEEFIANNEQEYINIAINIAKNTENLAKIRASLRNKMENSPLCDRKNFAKDIEKVYVDLWQKYSNQKNS